MSYDKRHDVKLSQKLNACQTAWSRQARHEDRHASREDDRWYKIFSSQVCPFILQMKAR